MNKEEFLKMAEESGVFHFASKFGFQSDAFNTSLEYFARAILERAAVECDNARFTISEFHDDDVKDAGINTCVNLASRIRALKTQGE